MTSPSPLLVNAHVHLPPNFSAFESVSQAIRLASEQDIAVLGTTNYYDYSVYDNFASAAKAAKIYPLFGIEVITLDAKLQAAGIKVNDPGNPGKFYLCAKGIVHFSPLAPKAKALLSVIRERDSARMAQMVTKIGACFAGAGIETDCSELGIKNQIAARSGRPVETVYLQERHVAQAFQEAFFAAVVESKRTAILEKLLGVAGVAPTASGVQNALRSHLMKAGKAAYVTETFVDFDHAYRLGLALGGIPCYPVVADGASPICGFEATPEALIANIQARNIHCAEWIPVRNQADILVEYVTKVRAAGLVLTAGTEHNTPEMIPLAPACVRGVAIPKVVEAIFWEGACVVAAHQHLVSLGECGYVDATGQLNPKYATPEERIAAFAEMGEQVILDTTSAKR
jgi:hypothetical protein